MNDKSTPEIALEALSAGTREYLGARATGGYVAFDYDAKSGSLSLASLRGHLETEYQRPVPEFVVRQLIAAAVKVDGGGSPMYRFTETVAPVAPHESGRWVRPGTVTMTASEFRRLDPYDRGVALLRDGVRVVPDP